jgi:hypothetical protein
VNRIRQFAEAWRQLRQLDSKAIPLVAAGVLLGALLGVGAGILIALWAAIVFGILFAGLGGLIVFSRRVQKAQFAAIDGQPGAAAAVLQSMRGQWFVTPAVAFTKQSDLVHRVVGRPGVFLIGEGEARRLAPLLAKERKRLKRVTGDVPVETLIVGAGDDQVPLSKLQVTLGKYKRTMSKTEVPKLERKLKPLDKGMPIPKGMDPGAVRGPRPRPR